MNKLTLDLHLEPQEFFGLGDTFKGNVSSPFPEEIIALQKLINHGTLVQFFCRQTKKHGYIQKIEKPIVRGKQTYLHYLVRLLD